MSLDVYIVGGGAGRGHIAFSLVTWCAFSIGPARGQTPPCPSSDLNFVSEVCTAPDIEEVE